MDIKKNTTLTFNSEESLVIHKLLASMSFNDYSRFVDKSDVELLKLITAELVASKAFPKLFNPFEV